MLIGYSSLFLFFLFFLFFFFFSPATERRRKILSARLNVYIIRLHPFPIVRQRACKLEVCKYTRGKNNKLRLRSRDSCVIVTFTRESIRCMCGYDSCVFQSTNLKNLSTDTMFVSTLVSTYLLDDLLIT